MREEQQFFELLQYSNKLKKKNKYLHNEDYDAFITLLNFLARIENNFHYSEKHEYIELAKNFMDDQISADDFSYSFMAIYEGIGKKLDQLKLEESLELANFLKSSQHELSELLSRIYGSCDRYSLDSEIDIATSDEKELKEFAQRLLVKLREK